MAADRCQAEQEDQQPAHWSPFIVIAAQHQQPGHEHPRNAARVNICIISGPLLKLPEGKKDSALSRMLKHEVTLSLGRCHGGLPELTLAWQDVVQRLEEATHHGSLALPLLRRPINMGNP